MFSAGFEKQDEDNQILDEIELYINLNFTHRLTQSHIDNIDIRSELARQNQNQEMKNSGWRFENYYSMTICFHKTSELNG